MIAKRESKLENEEKILIRDNENKFFKLDKDFID
jgi:hypothetical protein